MDNFQRQISKRFFNTKDATEEAIHLKACDAFNLLIWKKQIDEKSEYRFVRRKGILRVQIFIPEETPNGIIEHGLVETDATELIAAASVKELVRVQDDESI